MAQVFQSLYLYHLTAPSIKMMIDDVRWICFNENDFAVNRPVLIYKFNSLGPFCICQCLDYNFQAPSALKQMPCISVCGTWSNESKIDQILHLLINTEPWFRKDDDDDRRLFLHPLRWIASIFDARASTFPPSAIIGRKWRKDESSILARRF